MRMYTRLIKLCKILRLRSLPYETMCTFIYICGKWQFLILAMCIVTMPACAPVTDTRGNLPLAGAIKSIAQGKQNRDQVEAILGSPSTRATFGKQEIWYYIGKRTETLAFFEPTLIERKVLAIKFDRRGMVQTVSAFDASDGRPVKLVDRVTPTMGKKLGMLQQIIGNLGRFGGSEVSP